MSAPAEQLEPSAPTTRNGPPRSKALGVRDARKAYHIAMEAEKVRMRLKGGRIVGHLRRIDDELAEINARLKKGTILLDKEGQPVRELDGSIVYVPGTVTDEEAKAIALRLKTLQQRADIQFRQLSKIIPDLKSVEVSDKEDSPIAALGAAIAAAASSDGDCGST